MNVVRFRSGKLCFHLLEDLLDHCFNIPVNHLVLGLAQTGAYFSLVGDDRRIAVGLLLLVLDREEKGSGVIFLRSLGLEVRGDLVEDVGVDVRDQGIVEFFLQAVMPTYYTDIDAIFYLSVMP